MKAKSTWFTFLWKQLMNTRVPIKLTTIFLLIIGMNMTSFAATIYVDQINGDDMNDGLTLNTAVATITQSSLIAADGDTINVAQGVYSVTSGESFPVTFENVAAIQGAGVDLTVLDGELTTSVLEINSDSTLNLDGIAVINGFGSASSPGAGIDMSSTTQINLSNCLVENNEGNVGGGLFVVNTPIISINNCEFIGNEAAIGGAMQIQINSDIDVIMEVSQSMFSNNKGAIGTAIHFQENGAGQHTLNIDQTQFVNNESTGVAYQANSNTSFGLISNSIFAEHPGTAVSASSSDIDVINVTFVNNDKALVVGSQAEIVNSIFWNNEDEISGSGGSISYSIVQGLDIDEHNDDGNNLDIDPLLDNNYRLSMTSPAIDMGNDQAAIDFGLTQDIDSEPRIVDAFGFNRPEGVVDIGADEVPDLIFADGFE